jgi:anaerobic magnesium-protoporphyrin IX monomethyl ester cyclase
VADVLLTHSYHLLYDRKQVRKMQPYPPLGTLYAACALRMHGISVAVFDTMLQDPLTGFKDAVRVHRPKVVAIYEDDFNFLSKMCLTRMREVAWQMAEIARCAGATVISHGSDATDHAEEYLREGTDFVVLGEAETALAKLCSTLLRSGDPTSLEGIIRMSFGMVVRTAAIPNSAQWLAMPGPARDLIDIGLYREAWREAHGYFSLNLVASRGCPYRCNWCAKPISGNRFHIRSPKAVAGELRELKDIYGAEHAWFGDDVFALDHRWAREFAVEVQSRDCLLPFKIQTRADLLTPETVESLRRAGCAEVWMGVESGSQKVLNSMDKGLLVEEVISARGHLKNAGIRACYFLQFGYPGESWEDIQATVALVRETAPDDIGVSLSYPLPNTPFYNEVRAELGRKRNWTDSDDLCVMFKGAYTDNFYHAVRDALHAEVDAWKVSTHSEQLDDRLREQWRRVQELEPVSRNANPTVFSTVDSGPLDSSKHGFVSVQRLAGAREV